MTSRPLLHLTAVRAALGLDEDQVIALFDDGQIAWVWDIAGRDRRCKEYRVLPAALDLYLSDTPTLRYPETRQSNGGAEYRGDGEEEAMTLALPAGNGPMRLHALAVHWVCSQQHLGNLVADGLLAWSPETSARAITRGSASRFLAARRIV